MAVSVVWTYIVIVFVLMWFSASRKCSFEILKAEKVDFLPARSDIYLSRATLKFTRATLKFIRAKESQFEVVVALED